MDIIIRGFVFYGSVALFAMPSFSAPTMRPSNGPAVNVCNALESNEWNPTDNWTAFVCDSRQRANGVKYPATDAVDEVVRAFRIREADLEFLRSQSFIEHQLGELNSTVSAQNHGNETASSLQLFVTFYGLLLEQYQYVDSIIGNNTAIKRYSLDIDSINNTVNSISGVRSKIKDLLCAIRTNIGSIAARNTATNSLNADFNNTIFSTLGGESWRAYIVMSDTVRLMNDMIDRTNHAVCS